MAVAAIEEYKKVLWNHGGSSDEIFSHLSCHGQARATAANHLRETRGLVMTRFGFAPGRLET